MTVAETEQFEGRVVSLTTTYLEQVGACVELLPRLLEQYANDGPYRETVDRIRELESDSDRTNRRLSAVIARANNLGARFTRLHLNSGLAIELYQVLDRVANTAERFADEISAIGPRRSADCLNLLRDMSQRAVAAMAPLEVTVTEYVRMLCDPERTASIAEEIGRIRSLEGDCDGLRNEVIDTAFNGEQTIDPLIYRELALLLDGVVDAMEDVTDRMILATGNGSWIDLEPMSDHHPRDGR